MRKKPLIKRGKGWMSFRWLFMTFDASWILSIKYPRLYLQFGSKPVKFAMIALPGTSPPFLHRKNKWKVSLRLGRVYLGTTKSPLNFTPSWGATHENRTRKNLRAKRLST